MPTSSTARFDRFNSTMTTPLDDNLMIDGDSTVMICSCVMAGILIPINCFLIGVLVRKWRYLIRSPMSWIFLNVAFSDSCYLLVHAAWYTNQKLDIESPHYHNLCDSLNMFLRFAERMFEFSSSVSTLAIALVRAYSVYRSTRTRRTTIPLKYIVYLASGTWVASMIVPGTVIGISCATEKHQNCVVMPMYGWTERYHCIFQLLFINLPINVSYIYICVTLFRVKLITGSSAVDRSSLASRCFRAHDKTILYLIIYMFVYTLFAGGAHLYFAIFPGHCLSEYSGMDTLPLMLEILFPLGACGLNPLLLYALSSAIRKSISEILSNFRKCSTSSDTVEDDLYQ